MCRTMNELEKVIADYRSLKTLKEDLEEQLKDIEREIIGYMKPAKISPLNYQLVNAVQSIQNDLKQILDHWQNTSESASIEDYTLNKKYPLR